METTMGRNVTSSFGNSFDARNMYRQFNGELMPLQILGIGNPRAIVDAIANLEFQKLAEGILPAEIFKMLEPFIHSFANQMEKYLDAESERQHAAELRQNFGEPQSELALPVFHSLTVMAEASHEGAVAEASQAEKIYNWVVQEMKKTLLFYHATEVAKHQAKLKELEETQQAIADQKAQTKFASAEAQTMTQFLSEKKETFKQSLALAEAKLLAFTTQIFGSDFGTAENIIVSAQQKLNIDELDVSKAIPVTETDLSKTA